MEFTEYFWSMRERPDRAIIAFEWIEPVISGPAREQVQADGRIRLWGSISEMNGRYLRVILLADRQTVHNAFFDRTFRP